MAHRNKQQLGSDYEYMLTARQTKESDNPAFTNHETNLCLDNFIPSTISLLI